MTRFLFLTLLTISTSASAATFVTLPENQPLKLPFSDGVKVGNQVYVSGAIGVLPGTGDMVAGGIGPETVQTMKNIGYVLKHFGLNYSNLVRCQVMMADIKEWPAMNAEYVTYFGDGPFPARSAFAANGLALEARVEIECVAEAPEKP